MAHLPGHLRTCNAGASDRLQRFSCCEPSTGLLLCEHLASKTWRSEEHTSELQSRPHLVCRLLLEKKNISRASCSRPASESTFDGSIARPSSATTSTLS